MRLGILVGRIQLLLILLLLLLLLLHLLHQLFGSLRSVLLFAISNPRKGIDLPPWRHHGMAKRTRLRRRLVWARILIFRGIGDGDTFIPLRLLVLDRLAGSIALGCNGRPTLPGRQNHFLDRARIAGHAQNDIVELRSVQQRV